MTVFLVHPVKDDVSDAARFGTLESINSGYVYGDQIDDGRIPAVVQTALQAVAYRFKPDADYLLIAGDHIQLVTLAALLSSQLSWFNALRWERSASAYMPVRIQT